MISRRLLLALVLLPFLFLSAPAQNNDGTRTSSIYIYATANAAQQGRDIPVKSATVSADELRIPAKAKSEFDKGTACIAKKEWQKAEGHLLKAVAIYPQYATAYNNLGVVYARLGDLAREREALQKAIALNDHISPALLNLARLDMKQHDYLEAEDLLTKTVALDGSDIESMFLLAGVELENKHYEKAILTCRTVHTRPHPLQTSVHYIAARAMEASHRIADAAAELHTFLQEEPTGPRADAARQELSNLESYAGSQQSVASNQRQKN